MHLFFALRDVELYTTTKMVILQYYKKNSLANHLQKTLKKTNYSPEVQYQSGQLPTVTVGRSI